MSYYTSSSAVGMLDERKPFELITPGRALAEMRTIDSDVGSLARDIQASDVDANFKASFALFAQEWRAFYEDYTGDPLAWAARAQNSVLRKIESYHKDADSWRVAFQSRGGSVTMIKRDNPSGSIIPWLIFGGGVALGAYWLFKRSGETVVRFKKTKG